MGQDSFHSSASSCGIREGSKEENLSIAVENAVGKEFGQIVDGRLPGKDDAQNGHGQQCQEDTGKYLNKKRCFVLDMRRTDDDFAIFGRKNDVCLTA